LLIFEKSIKQQEDGIKKKIGQKAKEGGGLLKIMGLERAGLNR
jgi:hypothetical protein